MMVPKKLRIWFMVHCVVDPVATRLVAAALFGIGIESGLAWKAPIEAYRAMLSLKIIWSVAALIGLLIALVGGHFTVPLVGWALFIIFILFNILWVYWKRRLSREA